MIESGSFKHRKSGLIRIEVAFYVRHRSRSGIPIGYTNSKVIAIDPLQNPGSRSDWRNDLTRCINPHLSDVADKGEAMGQTITRRGFSTTFAATTGLAIFPQIVSASQQTDSDLAHALSAIEAQSGGRLGVTILDTGSSQRYGHRSTERFPMCSTFKLLACAAVLARVDAGKEGLNRRIRFDAQDLVTYSPVTKNHLGGNEMTLAALCEAAITQSDNTAGNLILGSLGGPSGVTAFARSIGDPVTRLDRTETDLNTAIPGDPRDTTTPDAMAGNLHSLVVADRLSRRSRDQLINLLVANQTGGARLRAGVPGNWRVGDKTGAGERGTTNDVAVLWPPGRNPLIACVYLTNTPASSTARDATIAAVGQTMQHAFES